MPVGLNKILKNVAKTCTYLQRHYHDILLLQLITLRRVCYMRTSDIRHACESENN